MAIHYTDFEIGIGANKDLITSYFFFKYGILFLRPKSWPIFFLDQKCRCGDMIPIVGPTPDSWLAARVAELIPISRCTFLGGILHSLQSLSVNFFNIILGLHGLPFPSNCISSDSSQICFLIRTSIKHKMHDLC